MKKRSRSFLGWLFALALFAPAHAHAASAALRSAANVILVTLDGVRWKEVFQGVDSGQTVDTNPKIFEFLTGTLAKQGVLYGNKDRGDKVSVANKHLNSLPGYQSILAGATQPCGSNLCGRIKVETFPERIMHDLGLKADQVATIASWEKIAHAAEHVEGTTFVNAGNRALTLGGDPINDSGAELNAKQEADTPPWKDARWDKYTFAHAINYLKTKRPRFLFISLNDSDEWGHKAQYDNYLTTLRQQDAWIKELVATLDSMGDYGRNTTLIITTDHGRGEGNEWHEHGMGYAGSEAVWIYGRSPHTHSPFRRFRRKNRSEALTHLDIRPTIEATFGLKPKLDGVSPLPGKVITAITGDTGTTATASASMPVRQPSSSDQRE